MQLTHRIPQGSLDVSSTISVERPCPQYIRRIVIVLDGKKWTERAIAMAIHFAKTSHAEIILVCTNHIGVHNYLHRQCAEVRKQHVGVRSFIINRDLSELPKYILKGKSSDGIMILQKQAGWLSRLFGGIQAHSLQQLSDATVIPVTV